ncbi:MAG: hypothetical protein KVP17_002749 [Porospora cf. gigantea B]|uniref:uncharacterized protein n=1 Tax=Porospora cf. gigantea B TaxID=2853592 RepID=UPI003571F464|nr:MAG: hypothetical protein KVP17_002749 [Porospora cf. gigantea B]
MLDRFQPVTLHKVLEFSPSNSERCQTVNRLKLVCKALEVVLRDYPCFGCQILDRVPPKKRSLCRTLFVNERTSIPDRVESVILGFEGPERKFLGIASLPLVHPSLKRLALWGSRLDTAVPQFITEFSGRICSPRELQFLPTQLTYLHLDAESPVYLVSRDIPMLETLALRGEFTIGSLPKSLKHLQLHECQLELARFPSNLRSCELTDVDFDQLPPLPNTVRTMLLIDPHPARIPLPSEVRRLEVETAAPPNLLWFPPSLRKLLLSCDQDIADEYIGALRQQCPLANVVATNTSTWSDTDE